MSAHDEKHRPNLHRSTALKGVGYERRAAGSPTFGSQSHLRVALLIAISTVQGVSQENTAPHGSKEPAWPVANECGVLLPFGRGLTEIRIYNYTDHTAHATIILASSSPRGQMFDGYILAREQANKVIDSHVRECLPGMTRIILPAARYTVTTMGAGDVGGDAGDVLAAFDVPGVEGAGYCVDLGSGTPEYTRDLAITPKDEKPVAEASADAVRKQIDRIANGSHQALPAPTQSSLAPGQAPGWSIQNATGYELHLYLSGPAERSYVIASGNSITVDLPSRSYRIAADVGHGVLPFYAVRQLGAARWSSHYYIAPH